MFEALNVSHQCLCIFPGTLLLLSDLLNIISVCNFRNLSFQSFKCLDLCVYLYVESLW